MIKYSIALFTFLLSSFLTVQADNLTQSISLIPTPTQMVPGKGNYLFSANTVFVVESKEQAEIVNEFTALLTRAAGFTPEVTVGGKKGDIRLVTDSSLKSEAYRLEVTPKGILINASDLKGFFYALQTLRLLLPSSIESAQVESRVIWSVPSIEITDEPRFGYRGLMLDAARFFIPKENVLRIIDCMAMLKINTLHFHLTDDNGWRLEIKKYPKLTEIGGWKVDRTNQPFPARRNPVPGEPTTIGGFYTQEDIKDIVAYASGKQIEVIPEIEMPAHSNAALASYPELACPVVKEFLGPLPGLGGTHAEVIYCAGNDRVFTFLQDVIDEVIELFPSRYIHLGGDEATKTNWEKCPLCQERMKKEHLACEEDLQGYFMKRMGDYVKSKGKEMMGWDELTNSTIPDGTIIYGWQGMGTAAMKAAERGHRFIMTPARVMYLIRYQGPQWFEPLTYFGNNTLKDVFDYEPIQKDWKPEYVSLLMGVQASLWTEFCNTPEDVDYLLFPRLAALAEVAWSQPEKKNWESFLKGMDVYNDHLAEKGIFYARSMYNIQHTVIPVAGTLKVRLECIRPDVEIRYTTNGDEPTIESHLYEGELTVDGTQTLKSTTFMKGVQVGKTLVLPITWNKATAKPIIGTNINERLLTNGVRGSLKQTDFEWCSWEKNDSISMTVDLQKSESLQTCKIGCITNYGMAVHKPALIRISVSDDNVNFKQVAELSLTPEEIFREGTYKNDFLLNLQGTHARYVRIWAKGAGICPDDHVRPGQEARMCFDEIMIE